MIDIEIVVDSNIDIEWLREFVKKLQEMQKECSCNCTLKVKI